MLIHFLKYLGSKIIHIYLPVIFMIFRFVKIRKVYFIYYFIINTIIMKNYPIVDFLIFMRQMKHFHFDMIMKRLIHFLRILDTFLLLLFLNYLAFQKFVRDLFEFKDYFIKLFNL